MIPYCIACGEVIPLGRDEDPDVWARRRICPDYCPAANRSARKAAELIEDIEWMVATGAKPAEICRRRQTTPEALARRLHRWGRPDLAAPIDAYAQRERDSQPHRLAHPVAA